MAARGSLDRDLIEIARYRLFQLQAACSIEFVAASFQMLVPAWVIFLTLGRHFSGSIRLWRIAESLNTPFHRLVSKMEKWVAEREKGR